MSRLHLTIIDFNFFSNSNSSYGDSCPYSASSGRTGCTIPDIITIRDYAIIGAGSVTRSDFLDKAIVTGFPARVNRWRFEDERIRILRT